MRRHLCFLYLAFFLVTSCSSRNFGISNAAPNWGSSHGLIDIQTEDSSKVRNLIDGQWMTVFSKNMRCASGNVGVITGFTQVTTEDNEVTFKARITVNGNPMGNESLQTVKQPDDTGGNHHQPIYAMATINCTNNSELRTEFQVQAQIVSRKRGEIFVDPPTGAGQKAGALMFERYGSDSNLTAMGLVASKRQSWGSSGVTPCCKQATYIPMRFFEPPIARESDLLVFTSSTVTKHDATTTQRGFDGEQFATIITQLNRPISAYLGVNTTSRFPVVSVFNQTSLLKTGNDNNYAVNVSGNFGRGAFVDNVSSYLETNVWRRGEGANFQSFFSTNIPGSDIGAELRPIKTLAVPNARVGDTVKVDLLVTVNSESHDSRSCRFDVNNSESATSTFVSVGQGYRFSTARLSMSAKLNSSDASVIKVFSSCTRNTTFNSGQLFVTLLR